MTEEITNINLEDFVFEVLRQIINGIKKSQAHAKSNGALINSRTIYRTTKGDLKLDISNHGINVEEIEFDVAVTVSSQGNLKGGMGLFIPAVGIGYQANKETGNSIVSRIKFKVPVAFPPQEETIEDVSDKTGSEHPGRSITSI